MMTNLRLIATAVVSLAVGGAIGYKYAEKKLVAEFEERLDRETNALRRMYKKEFDTPEEMVEELYGEAAEAMREYLSDGTPAPKDPVAYHKIRVSGVPVGEKEEKVIERSVFEPADDRGEIYVISAEEHAAGDAGYEQATWTYYARDGVVTDPAEDRIEDYANFLGPDFAQHFGEGSGDENVVYIRNEVVMMDYEIVRSHGAYVEEVLQEEYTPPVERPSQRMRGN